MSNNVTISGRVVAEPELKEVNGYTILNFPLYDNEQRKDKETGEYKDTGKTLKLRVSLFGDLANEWQHLKKGSVVEIQGSITEEEFTKKDGTPGRQLVTTFVNDVRLIWEPQVQDAPSQEAVWA